MSAKVTIKLELNREQAETVAKLLQDHRNSLDHQSEDRASVEQIEAKFSRACNEATAAKINRLKEVIQELRDFP